MKNGENAHQILLVGMGSKKKTSNCSKTYMVFVLHSQN